jgi:hypothetical protein
MNVCIALTVPSLCLYPNQLAIGIVFMPVHDVQCDLSQEDYMYATKQSTVECHISTVLNIYYLCHNTLVLQQIIML